MGKTCQTRLKPCDTMLKVGRKEAFRLQPSQGSPQRGQVILWDAARGHFADVVGDQKAMERLGKEVATRQALATKPGP